MATPWRIKPRSMVVNIGKTECMYSVGIAVRGELTRQSAIGELLAFCLAIKVFVARTYRGMVGVCNQRSIGLGVKLEHRRLFSVNTICIGGQSSQQQREQEASRALGQHCGNGSDR